MKDYVEDLFPGRATVGVAVGPAPKAPLSQHGQVQHGTGLGKGSSGIVGRHIAGVTVVDLKNWVSSKKSSIAGDHPIPTDFLDNNVDQWHFIAAHNANSAEYKDQTGEFQL